MPPTLARGSEQQRGGGTTAARVAMACECVVQERAGRSLDRARIPSRYEHCTFESFETDYFEGPQASAFNDSLAQAKLVVEGFARDYPLTNDAGFLLIGPCGAGKTHLAIAAMKELVARGHDALFYDYRELLKEIQASYNAETTASEMSVLDPVLRVEVLLLDDLGASKPSAWALETIGHILTTRYNDKRITLLTSNYLDGAEATEPAPRQRSTRLPPARISPPPAKTLWRRGSGRESALDSTKCAEPWRSTRQISAKKSGKQRDTGARATTSPRGQAVAFH